MQSFNCGVEVAGLVVLGRKIGLQSPNFVLGTLELAAQRVFGRLGPIHHFAQLVFQLMCICPFLV